MHFFLFSSISPHTLLSRNDNVTIHSWKYSRTIKLTFLSVRSSFSQWFIPLDCRPKSRHTERGEKGSCTSWSARPSPRRYECQWVVGIPWVEKIFLAHTKFSLRCLFEGAAFAAAVLCCCCRSLVEWRNLSFAINFHRVTVYTYIRGGKREVISAAEDHADGWNRIYLFIMYARLGRTRRQPREREECETISLILAWLLSAAEQTHKFHSTPVGGGAQLKYPPAPHKL